MKVVSFKQGERRTFGVVIGDRVADLGDCWPTLKAAIAENATPAELQRAASAAPTLALADVELTLPVPDAERYVCAGLNFRAHALEGGFDAPKHPSLFLRSASTFVPHGQPLLKPQSSSAFDYECEFAVVIGRRGRHIRPEDAMDHVFGYTLLMDGSMRDVQFEHSLTAGKNFYASGSVGPWIVTADEIEDPAHLQLIGRVNGEQRQSAPLSDLIFDIPTLVSYWSRIDALSPGDLISVGTPSGVGFAMEPKRFLQPGDVVETEVPGVGVLRNSVVAEHAGA